MKADVVLADGITPLPRRVWDLVEQVRDAVLTAIEDCGPADCTFIFTNFIRAAEPETPKVAGYLARLERLARDRGGELRCVVLTCAPDELYRRVGEPSRRERLKSWDVAWVRKLVVEEPLFEPSGPHVTRLDITSLAPELAARKILEDVPT